MKSRLLLSAGSALVLSLLFLKQNPEPVSAFSPSLPGRIGKQAPTRQAPPLPQLSLKLSAPADSPLAAFASWATLYRQTSAAERPALISTGLTLAQHRRQAMLDLIRRDPRAALAAALPFSLRTELPEEIAALLEENVSGTGDISLTYRCFHEGNDHSTHDHSPVRTVIHNGRQFQVHTYGSRLVNASVSGTTFRGIALDRELALAEERTRILEPGETAGPRPFHSEIQTSGLTSETPLNLTDSPVATEAGGTVHLFRSRNEIPAFEAALRRREIVNLGDNQPGTSTVVGRPSQSWTHGPKKILVIRVDFSDLTGVPVNYYDGNAPITDDYVSNVINGPGGVAEFMAASSFGKTSLVLTPSVAGDSPDVTPVFRLPNTASSYATTGNSELLHDDARAAATAAGFNLDAYDRIGVVFSRLNALNGSKITYGGLGNLIGRNFWVNAAFDLRLVSHELGHTYGLEHSNLWKVTDGNPLSENGKSKEYGDIFDIMGDGQVFTDDFSPWNKSLLQWIPDSAVTVANADGTFRIRRFDSADANLAQPRALKIVRDSTRDYWIGYRRATNNASMDGGAYVTWGYNTTAKGNLLDLNTPNSNPDDAGLAIGQSLTDTTAGITITPVAQGGSGSEEWLDVQVAFQPRIRWTSNTFIINEQGASAVLSLKRDGNANGAVSVNYATVAGVATSPADFTASSGNVTWANGDTADKTITIPVVADALVEGSENFTVTLSGISGGVIVDGVSATVTLADPGSRDTSFAADFINNSVLKVLPQPDGTIYVAGFFTQLQDAANESYTFRRIARMKAEGTIDTTFNPGTGANDVVRSASVLPDGKILIGGDFGNINGTARNGIARLHSSGTLDTSLNPGSGANNNSFGERIFDALPLPNGKILIAGAFTRYNGTDREYVARLNSDGSLDTSFVGPDFADTTGWKIRKLAVQTDGKILIGGTFYFTSGSIPESFCRLNTDGSRDTSFTGIGTGPGDAFGGGGFAAVINDILIQPDGKILVAGDFISFNGNTTKAGLVRLNSTGVIDTTFTATANQPVNTLVFLPDGRLLAGGDFTTINGGAATRIARLSTTGTLDTGFAAAGGHAGTVHTLALQADGKVLLGGNFASFQNAPDNGPLWRFHGGLPALPGTLEFSADAFTGDEGASVVLSVTRTGGSAGSVSVSFSTVAGSATTADFTPTAGILTWANGDAAAKTITVPLTADASAEPVETFLVNLGAPTLGSALLDGRRQTTVSVATPLLNWQSANFNTSELADPLVSGDLADPDQDGVSNLLEFAFGSAPRSSDQDRLPSAALTNVSGTNYLSLSLRRRTGSSGLAYAVQTSPFLSGPWTANAIQVGSPVNQGDGFEVLMFRDSVPSSGAARFMRVLITSTP